jgi:soluble lytic murein transglycosylase-like protein
VRAPAVPYASVFAAASAAYGIPRGLLEGVAYVESGFRPSAVNHDANGTEDVGIMQLNLQAQHVSYAFAANPVLAIPYAARLLATYYRECGSWTGAIERYNSGQCAGDSGYAARVFAAARQYGYQGPEGAPATGTTASAAAASGLSGTWMGLSAVTWVRIGLLVLAAVVFVVGIARLE